MIVNVGVDIQDMFYEMDEEENFQAFKIMDESINDIDFTERIFDYCLDTMIETDEFHGRNTEMLIEKMKEYIKLMDEKL